MEKVLWAYCSISDDEKKARESVRTIITASVWTSRRILSSLGIGDVSRPIVRTIQQAFDEGLEQTEAWRRATALAHDSLWDTFAIAGTSETCIRKVHELVDAGIEQIAILPYPSTGKEREDVMRLFAKDVMSQFN
jgi:alkanesulfonate monooxygenase SsuD/methylene tetrahydromethanopterin reductase-like flavin-dependent oxidoreductase (luciferase family)